MADPVQNALLEDHLLGLYFPKTRSVLKLDETNLYAQLEMQILEEGRVLYQQRIETLKTELSKEDFEEELFVRGGVFKREIPRIYDYQCAISGMRIESTSSAQMVDACHIVPFSQSNDDTIRNGISLSPNLHRAFDRGLLTITTDYTVWVSPSIRERSSPFALQQFHGKTIHLPTNSAWYPAPENLDWHQRECFIP